jgi:hypothetical protein
LEDERGKPMKAIDVFSRSIEFLKEHLLGVLVEQGMKDKDEAMEQTRWVLTVPAIWTDPAKEFMKEAATRVLILILLLYHSNSSVKSEIQGPF